METKMCADCQYFVQHYYKCRKKYSKTYCGHCFYPRVKARKPDTPACDKFTEKEQKN